MLFRLTQNLLTLEKLVENHKLEESKEDRDFYLILSKLNTWELGRHDKI